MTAWAEPELGVGSRFGSCLHLAALAFRQAIFSSGNRSDWAAERSYAAAIDEPIPQGNVVTGGGKDAPGFCWATLVARVLHPTEVQIVEAFQWIEEPLSAGDLSEVFDGKPSWVVVCRHIRRLTKLEALELEETPTFRDFTDIRYRLAQGPPRNER